MIDTDSYYATCRLKKAQFFVISIKDLEYQVEKEAKPETNLKNVLPEEYYDLLDIFSKKSSNTLLLYQKYDHNIILEEK